MTFAGVKDAAGRADLIAFLQQANSAQAAPAAGHGSSMGAMWVMGAQRRNLKEVEPSSR
jgi:hypothetical protein